MLHRKSSENDEQCLHRFGTTFLGSRAVSGTLVGSGLLGAHELAGGGASLAEALASHGYDPSPSSIAAIAVPPAKLRGCDRNLTSLGMDA